MKKEYIKPEMQMHEIKAQQMLAGSETPGFNPGKNQMIIMKKCGKVLS